MKTYLHLYRKLHIGHALPSTLPPKGNEAKIPQNLYGIQPSGDILGRLLKATFDGRESTKHPSPKEVCEYGWYEDNTDKKFHNVYSDEIVSLSQEEK